MGKQGPVREIKNKRGPLLALILLYEKDCFCDPVNQRKDYAIKFAQPCMMKHYFCGRSTTDV